MAATAAVSPNQSIYVQNLSEKLQKHDLRRALYMLFSTYGPVLDVTALKTKQMRGQAHILFRDVHSATLAMRSCQGMELFGREMRISYSKNRSNTLARLTGTVNRPPPTEVAKTTSAAKPTTALPPPPGTTASSGLPPPPGLQPAKIGEVKAAEVSAPSPQGTKRPREDDEEEEEAPVDEGDDDDEGAMEMSDEDD